MQATSSIFAGCCFFLDGTSATDSSSQQRPLLANQGSPDNMPTNKEEDMSAGAPENDRLVFVFELPN